MTQLPDLQALDPPGLVAYLATAQRNVKVGSARFIGQASDNVAVEINRRVIFRIPRNLRVSRHLSREARLLTALGSRLPIRVPGPVSIVPLESPSGWKAMTYPRIHGRALDWSNLDTRGYQNLVHGLRPALAALAAFPTELALRLGTKGRSSREWWKEMKGYRRYLSRVVYREFPAELRSTLDSKLQAYLNDDRNFQFRPTLLHTDLHSSHVIWMGGHPAGIIDWGDAEIGDPAREFAQWAAHFGSGDVLEFSENRVDGDELSFVRRVEVYRLFRPLWRVSDGIRSGDPAKIRDGVAWLRRALTIDPSKGWSR